MNRGLSERLMLPLTVETSTTPRMFRQMLASASAAVALLSLNAAHPQVANAASAFLPQHGRFDLSFDTRTSSDGETAYVGLSQRNSDDPSHFAAAIRFDEAGKLDVLNGQSFQPANFPYEANVPYHIRMAVDVGAHSYTVFVSQAGKPEQVLAANAAFAPSQQHVKSLGYAGKNAAPGDVEVNKLRVQRSCPYEAQALAAKLEDGCAKAPESGFSNPAILTKYGANRPQWDVAGVDYPVGTNPSGKFVDWQSLASAPGIDLYNGVVRCDGPTASHPATGPVVLDGVDFTTHGGTMIYVPTGGCVGLTVKHSRFGSAPGGAGCSYFNYWFIQDQNVGSPLKVERNTFDGTKCVGANASVLQSYGPLTVHYNYFGHLQSQVVQAPTGAYPVDYRFNYIEDCCWSNGTHMNFQEFGGAVDATMDLVAFNTSYLYRTTPANGEEYQFYGNAGGTQQAAMLENNTIIALDTGSCQSSGSGCLVSYAIHGTSNTNPYTGVGAQPLNMNNYFDTSGMYGAYYPGSMQGWNSSGNLNMLTGKVITPP